MTVGARRAGALAIELRGHQRRLRACTACPRMTGPVITGEPVPSRVIVVGQAPGVHEGRVGKPFGWTAGRTLFGWFEGIGLAEAACRQRIYLAAVCRCFPGKNPGGGDRVPSAVEVDNCAVWLRAELELLRPQLLIPVGKLAIAQFLPARRLSEVVGTRHRVVSSGIRMDTIPLPHPSGASTWHRTEPGKSLLPRALGLIRAHPAWRRVASRSPMPG